MATGAEYTNFVSKRILGTDDFKTRFLEYMIDRVSETNVRQYSSAFFHPQGVTLVSAGADIFDIETAGIGAPAVASDGLGNFLEFWESDYQSIPFENLLGVDYHVALKHCVVPYEVQINPNTGNPEWFSYKEQIGESASPDQVQDNGDGTLTFRVNSVLESGVDNTGRTVLVYKNTLAKGATTFAVALESCTVSYSGGNNSITTTGFLGMDTFVPVASYYTVVVLGPTIKRYTDLSLEDGYCYIGFLTGTGPGNPPTSFDDTDQKVVSHVWTDVLINGLNQNFWPAIDNTYSLGDTTHRWSEIYTVDLLVSGNFLPSSDATQDIGASGTRWQDGYFSGYLEAESLAITGAGVGVGVMDDFVPSANDTYDLGSSSYRWAEIHCEESNHDHLIVEDSGSATTGVGSGLVPDTTDTYDLGSSSYEWDSIVARASSFDYLTLSWSAGDGVTTDFNPATTGAYDLGSSSYRWNEIRGIDAFFDNCDVAFDVAIDRRISLTYGGTTPGVESNWNPNATDTYSLGDPFARWYNVVTSHFDLGSAVGEGCLSNIFPYTTDTSSLGSATYRWLEGHFKSITLGAGIGGGNGVDSHVRPVTTDTYWLGSSSYRWDTAIIRSVDTRVLEVDDGGASGVGVVSGLVPGTDDTYDFGDTSYRWHDIRISGTATFAILDLASGAGEGVLADLFPVTDDASDLGSSSYQWADLYIDGDAYIDTLYLSSTAGEGCATSVVPAADGSYLCGSASYAWDRLYSDEVITGELSISGTPTTGGVGSDLMPKTTNSYSFGDSTYYWQNVYTNNLYYKTTFTTFDDVDDLALVKKYVPTKQTMTITKKGKRRTVRKADPTTIPWPMLGNKDHTTGDYFLHGGDSITFLLGAIKQLCEELGKVVSRVDRLEQVV